MSGVPFESFDSFFPNDVDFMGALGLTGSPKKKKNCTRGTRGTRRTCTPHRTRRPRLRNALRPHLVLARRLGPRRMGPPSHLSPLLLRTVGRLGLHRRFGRLCQVTDAEH